MKTFEKKFEIFWEIPDCPPYLTLEPARFFTNNLKPFCGKNFPECILSYTNRVNTWYLDGSVWDKLDEKLFSLILKDPKKSNVINNLPKQHCPPCLSFLNSLSKKDTSQSSKKQIYTLYTNFFNIYTKAHSSGHLANLLEMKNQRLSLYLKKYIEEHKKNTIFKNKTCDEIFTVVTTPQTYMSFERETLDTLLLAKYIFESKQKLDEAAKNEKSNIYKKVEKHKNKWCWTPYNYEGPAATTQDYLDTLKNLLGVNPLKKLEDFLKERKDVLQQKNSLLSTIFKDQKTRKLCKIAEEIMFYKALRKDCMYKGAYVASEKIYKPIARFLNISLKETRFILKEEMYNFLFKKKPTEKLLRSKTHNTTVIQRENEKDVVLLGKRADIFLQKLNVKKQNVDIKELKGQIAFKGRVSGIAKYINTPDMMHKMNDGDILISYATQPNIIPAMKKAKAFVTDFGGITCHAAIIAREWKVPCIIGTGNATKAIKDGDLIEVDAMKGVVKILKRSQKKFNR